MANISVNIDLLKLTNAVKKVSEKGNKYLAIPLNGNNIFEGEKGCYLKLVAIEMKEPKDKKTHFVKQEGTKDQDLPIIGDAIYWGKTGVTPTAKSEPENLPSTDSNHPDLPF